MPLLAGDAVSLGPSGSATALQRAASVACAIDSRRDACSTGVSVTASGGRCARPFGIVTRNVVPTPTALVTATCPNTGSMLGLITPGSIVWLSESDSPTRKYRHTWELVEADLGKGPTLVGINTGHPNKLLAEAIGARRVKALADAAREGGLQF